MDRSIVRGRTDAENGTEILGTLVGVLPGLGPVAAMSMLLPVTYGMSPTGAIITACTPLDAV